MTEAQCRAIQNYGEQHPQFHSIEMKEWRKRDSKENWMMELAQIKAMTDGRPVSFLELLEERAKEISPDYPFDGSNAFDWLWAIVSSYTGTHQANQDCHAFIKHLGTKAGLDDNGVYQEWMKFKGDKT